jgi:hypothetical protein
MTQSASLRSLVDLKASATEIFKQADGTFTLNSSTQLIKKILTKKFNILDEQLSTDVQRVYRINITQFQEIFPSGFLIISREHFNLLLYSKLLNSQLLKKQTKGASTSNQRPTQCHPSNHETVMTPQSCTSFTQL